MTASMTRDEETTCVHCAGVFPSGETEIMRAGEACESCQSEMVECGSCEILTHPDEINGETRSGKQICEECARDRYSYCENCEVLVLDEYYGGDQEMCMRCVRDTHFACESCGDWWPDDMAIGRDSGTFCEYCDPGDDEPEGVHAYKSGAPWGLNFISTTGMGSETREERPGLAYLGVEFEMVGDAWVSDVADILARAERNRDGHAEVDSSVDGIEWISQPASLGAWRGEYGSRVSEYLKDLQGREFVAGNEQCGQHVHISREAFDGPRHIATFAAFFTYNDEVIRALSGRVTDTYLERWASVRKYGTRELSNTLRGLRGADRYRAVNLRNRNTLEVRVFAGTDDFSETLGTLEFVHALAEYTRGLTSGDVLAGALLADSFVAWLEDKDREGEAYPYALWLFRSRAGSTLVHATN